MRINLERYAPAGFPIMQEIKVFIWTLGISAIFSMGFLIRYFDARNELYDITITGQKVLNIDAVMPHMSVLVGNAFIGFYLLSLLALAGAIYHYLFHSQGSKSIYLMRRLPNRWEFHKRCLTLPILAIVAGFLCALLLYLLYYLIYMCCTPTMCLPKVSLPILRSVLL